MQYLVLPFGEFHEVPVRSFLQLVNVLPVYQILLPVCTVCKLAEGTPNPIIQVINEDVKQFWP